MAVVPGGVVKRVTFGNYTLTAAFSWEDTGVAVDDDTKTVVITASASGGAVAAKVLSGSVRLRHAATGRVDFQVVEFY